MRLTLYAAPAGPDPPRDDGVVRRLRGREEILVEHVGARQLDPGLRARARPARGRDRVAPDARRLRQAGRSSATRDAFGAFSGDQCVAVLLRETASPGLCLSGLMSAPRSCCRSCRAPIRTAPSSCALCDARAGDARCPAIPPNRFLFVRPAPTTAPCSPPGWRPIGECTYFALHRLGIVEYQRYIADKYGLLQARLHRRTARLGEAA